MSHRTSNDYEIGYGKPPEKRQFKKGVSGNPKGRPKKNLDFDSEVMRELNSSFPIVENGRRRRIKKGALLAKQMVNKALSGNINAVRLVLNSHVQSIDQVTTAKEWAEKDPGYVSWKTTMEQLKDATEEELDLIIAKYGERKWPKKE